LFADFCHEAWQRKIMRGLLAVSVLIIVIAVAMPKLFTQYMGQSEPATPPAAASVSPGAAEETGEAASASSAGREVEIKAGRDGHFYVDASVNLRPVRLMVDTGATVVALRASDAAAAGIRVREADYVNPVATANGTTNAAEATLDSVSVDDIEVRHVRALVIHDDQLAVSLLGGSFLHGLRRFEVKDDILTFEN
jgi:aspartyl protease family protein